MGDLELSKTILSTINYVSITGICRYFFLKIIFKKTLSVLTVDSFSQEEVLSISANWLRYEIGPPSYVSWHSSSVMVERGLWVHKSQVQAPIYFQPLANLAVVTKILEVVTR